MPLDPVTDYAEQVVSMKEMAGPLVRLACQRHLDDLEHGPKRGLKWDWSRVDADGDEIRGTGKYVADFFENELLLEEGKPFRLEPPLMFIVGSLFGWKGPDGFRRFRIAYIEIGKGNAKTKLGGGLGIYMTVADGEYRADCYAAAHDREQAKIPFKDAVSFVDLNPRLDSIIQRSGGVGREYNLAYLRNGSSFAPVSSENKGRGKSGFRPHFVLLDEIHEHQTDSMVELAIANLKTRTQPLVFMITNSGIQDRTLVWYLYHERGERMLKGQDANNDSQFFYICGLDEGDSWMDPAIRKKGNPMLAYIPGMERYLQERVDDAKGMPSKQSIVRRLNFCEAVGQESPFVATEIWLANGGRVDEESLRGRTCFGGLDLSGKNDLSAFILLFEPDETGKKRVICRFWTPKDTVVQREARDRAPYQQWIRDGFLIAVPGRSIDYEFIAKEMAELAARFEISCTAFDKYRIEDLERELDNESSVSIVLKEHGQGFIDMNPSIQILEDHLLNEEIAHGNHPILTWCVNNARVVQDASENRKFDKRTSTGRIDGIVALAMAAGLMASQPETASYEVTLIR